MHYLQENKLKEETRLKRENKLIRAGIPSKMSLSDRHKINTIDVLITQLEQLTSPQENHTQKVSFATTVNAKGELEIPKNEIAIENHQTLTYNPDLKSMINYNFALKNVCHYQFSKTLKHAPSEQELLDEMQIAEYFIGYFIDATSKFPFSLALPSSAIINIIEYYYPTINFIKEIMHEYAFDKDFDDSLIGAVEIIKSLTPFAVYYLEFIDAPLTTETILLQTIPNLKDLIHMAYERLLDYPFTYENQIKELGKLEFLYQFVIKTRKKSELNLETILEDMKSYELMFDEALLNTISEDPALLEAEMRRLVNLSSSDSSETNAEFDATDEDFDDIEAELGTPFPSASKNQKGDDLPAKFDDILPQEKPPSGGVEIEV